VPGLSKLVSASFSQRAFSFWLFYSPPADRAVSAIWRNRAVMAENGMRWQMTELSRAAMKDRQLERFIAALHSTPSVESAAQSARIGVRTGWRWMRDPGVLERLADLRRQSMQHAMTRLQAAASAAVTCLCELQGSGESESAPRAPAGKCKTLG
jgi:hypothetical protein